jgi:pyridoxamine 5'-phosphate oxidase
MSFENVPRPAPKDLPSFDERSLADPVQRFALWWQDIRADTRIVEPAEMTLASVDEHGHPSARVVLLRSYDERGFVFYTNLQSRKGRELLAQPRAALCFHWVQWHRQVRVEGRVVQVADDEANAYFASRPRDSQLSAWASAQSTQLTSMQQFEDQLAQASARFTGTVPRPPHWSGLRVVPHAIEFWQEGPHRRHRRDAYRLEQATWQRRLLSP